MNSIKWVIYASIVGLVNASFGFEAAYPGFAQPTYINDKGQADLQKIQLNRFEAHEYIWSTVHGKRNLLEWDYYYQRRLDYDDSLSDLALCFKTFRVYDNMPANIFKALFKRDYERLIEEREQLAAASKTVANWGPDSYPGMMDQFSEFDKIDPEASFANETNESATPPIRIDGFIQMLQRVMWEEFHQNSEVSESGEVSKHQLFPRYGTPHVYTKEFKEKLKRVCRFKGHHSMTKLLLTLASGESWRVMRTGAELPLMKYLTRYQKNQVSPDMIFRYSYRLNRGDVYLTLLTIENVLSRYWRFRGRGELRHIQSLMPISNVDRVNGDKFGNWYHFFGGMLYAYVMGSRAGRFVVDFETFGSRILSGEKEKQESLINQAGVKVGAALKEMLLEFDQRGKGPQVNEHFIYRLHKDDQYYGAYHFHAFPDFYLDLDEGIPSNAYVFAIFDRPSVQEMWDVISLQNPVAIKPVEIDPPIFEFQKTTPLETRKRFVRRSCKVYKDRVERFERVDGELVMGEIFPVLDSAFKLEAWKEENRENVPQDQWPVVIDWDQAQRAYQDLQSTSLESKRTYWRSFSGRKTIRHSTEFWMRGPWRGKRLRIQGEDWVAHFRTPLAPVRSVLDIMDRACRYQKKSPVFTQNNY